MVKYKRATQISRRYKISVQLQNFQIFDRANDQTYNRPKKVLMFKIFVLLLTLIIKNLLSYCIV